MCKQNYFNSNETFGVIFQTLLLMKGRKYTPHTKNGSYGRENCHLLSSIASNKAGYGLYVISSGLNTIICPAVYL